MFFYLLTIIAAFFSRKIFLDNLGAEFIGLVSLIQEILKFLNLAELGVSTAVGYALYKPLLDKDYSEINHINTFFGLLYRKIGVVILSVGIIVSIFLPVFFSETTFTSPIIYFAFFTFLINTIFNYFFNYHITVLEADQKKYIVSKYFQGFGILKSIVQISLVLVYKSFYLWITIELIFSLIIVFVLRWQIKKVYPWLTLNLPKNTKNVKKFPEIITKVKQIFVHKFSFFILNGTDQILIYWFVNIQSVAFYGNYLMVIGYLSTFINQIFSGAQAGVGNLIAEKNIINIKKVFWELIALRHFLGGFLFLALYYLVNPFILIWLGETYILDENIVFLMLLTVYIGQVRKPVDDYINAYGIFSDTWAPATEAVLNLGLSLVLGSLYGILGIVIGTIASMTLMVLVWKPFFLYKKGFKESVLEYWISFFKLISSLILTFLIVNYLKNILYNNPITTFLEWFVFAFVLCITIIIIYSIFLFFIHQGFRDFIFRIKIIITNFIKNGTKS